MTQAEELDLRRAGHEWIDTVGEDACGVVCRLLRLFVSDDAFYDCWRKAVFENGFPSPEEAGAFMDRWEKGSAVNTIVSESDTRRKEL